MAAAPPSPPTPETPYWRDELGRRTTVRLLLAGRPETEREALMHQHEDAVCRIVRAAGAATLEGRDRQARALANHASKLCGELAGLWPAGSHEPLA